MFRVSKNRRFDEGTAQIGGKNREQIKTDVFATNMSSENLRTKEG